MGEYFARGLKESFILFYRFHFNPVKFRPTQVNFYDIIILVVFLFGDCENGRLLR
jgi:hypothetical protein